MKRCAAIFCLLGLVLCACGPTDAAAAEDPVALVYTAAALTLTAQATLLPSSTADPSTPTLTPTQFSSPTPVPTATTLFQPAATSTYSYVSSSSGCDDSAFLSDVTIPDGTELAPGEAFTKTWKFQNTGSCAWTTSYDIVFVSGSAMSGSTTALSSSTESGGQINVSVSLVAPSTTGTYTGYWKLQNAAGTRFGQSVYVQIVVSDDASTLTPTATDEDATGTPTSTTAYTSAPTTASTSTAAPTATTAPTSTPVPTTPPISTPVPAEIPTETPSE
jgi:hypothetical protein